MIERIALLAGQYQPSLRRTVKRSMAVTIRNTVALAGRQHRRGQAKPLLHRNHVAAGKPLLILPVLAQSDKLGGTPHRCHD
jgi:hypothetical protein